LISIDGASSRPYREGAEILDATLISVQLDAATFEVAGSKITITFPHRETRRSNEIADANPNPKDGPIGKLLAATGSEGLAPYPVQSNAGSGNSTFLEAMGKASNNAIGR